MKHFFLLIIFIFSSIITKSQNTPSVRDTTLVTYTTQKRCKNRNIVKVNLVSPIIGDLAFYYERVIFRWVSMEGGAGVLLPYYLQDGAALVAHEHEVNKPDLGYSLWLHPRFYFMGKAPEYNYVGFQYRLRHYNLKNGQQIEYTDISFNLGFQFFLSKRLMFDYNLGVGFRFRKYPVAHVANKETGIIGITMPLNFRLGYAF
jgi:hypothetical protein